MAIVNKTRFLEILEGLRATDDFASVRSQVAHLRAIIAGEDDDEGVVNIAANGDTISLRTDTLLSEVGQVLDSYTLERARYYLKRLAKAATLKTNKINDINLLRWKEYDHIITDSLWVVDKRDSSGAHTASYWGNFIPQIPHQMMLRYTRKGDWVLDAFAGSGTTLIECRRLGRNCIGVELNPAAVADAEGLLRREAANENVVTSVVLGDSRTLDVSRVLREQGVESVQLLIMHPPYHDIIKFSDSESDLSNAADTQKFLDMFGAVVDNLSPCLERGRYLVLVIGDKYSKGEWIPLGFRCMDEVLKRSYSLKAIIVKNFDETRAKRNQKELWRYRALVGGLYVFKHEYVMLFKKTQRS